MQRASVTRDEVVTMVKRLYGFTVSHYDELNSYDDVNLHIYVKDSLNGMPISQDGYVLKILNSVDSEKVKFVDAMHAAIFKCYEAGITTPRPLANMDGNFFSIENLSTSKHTGGKMCKFLVRLFEYIPGDLLRGKPCTPHLCYSVGQTAAGIDKALMGFYHAGYDNHARHWCLSRVEFLLDKIDALDNEEDRDLVREVVNEFKTNVVDNYHKLQKGVIHGDINDQNLLVKPGTHLDVSQLSACESVLGINNFTANDIYSVVGVLDFGDSVYKYQVFDIAITMMYMILQKDNLDLIDVGGITLAGYLSILQLPFFDLTVLKECICGRFAQSLVYGAYEYNLDPSNKYVLQTSAKGWLILRQLWPIPKKTLYEKWRTMLNNFNINVNLDLKITF